MIWSESTLNNFEYDLYKFNWISETGKFSNCSNFEIISEVLGKRFNIKNPTNAFATWKIKNQFLQNCFGYEQNKQNDKKNVKHSIIPIQ